MALSLRVNANPLKSQDAVIDIRIQQQLRDPSDSSLLKLRSAILNNDVVPCDLGAEACRIMASNIADDIERFYLEEKEASVLRRFQEELCKYEKCCRYSDWVRLSVKFCMLTDSLRYKNRPEKYFDGDSAALNRVNRLITMPLKRLEQLPWACIDKVLTGQKVALAPPEFCVPALQYILEFLFQCYNYGYCVCPTFQLQEDTEQFSNFIPAVISLEGKRYGSESDDDSWSRVRIFLRGLEIRTSCLLGFGFEFDCFWLDFTDQVLPTRPFVPAGFGCLPEERLGYVPKKMRFTLPSSEPHQSALAWQHFLKKRQIPDRHLSLDRLLYFVDEKGIAYLNEVSKGTEYDQKLTKIKKDGFKSPLYKKKETCNLLWWAYNNKKITEKQFIENYHYLCLCLTFDSTIFSWADSTVADRFDIQCKSGTSLFGDDFSSLSYQIHLSEELVSMLRHPSKETEDISDNKKTCLNHLMFWMRLFEQSVCGINLDGKTLSIASMETLAKKIPSNANPVVMKPGFGFGDWDQLKKLRLCDEHPLALWHHELSSLTQPDGYWIGCMPYLHDIYHATLLNGLGKPLRDKALAFDTIAVEPVLGFLTRAQSFPVSGAPDDEDACFITGVAAMFDYLQTSWATQLRKKLKGECFPWGIDLASCLEKINERKLLDQEYVDDKGIEYAIERGFMGRFVLYWTSPGTHLQTSYFLFNQIVRGDKEQFKALYNLELREYPEVRDYVDQLGKKEMRADYRHVELEKAHKNGNLRWYIDYWVRYCRYHAAALSH